MLSILIAKEDCIEHERPSDLEDFKQWRKDGYMVIAEYIDLETPIKYKDYIEDILKLQGDKYAPFHKGGRGNTGYLFRVTTELAEFLLNVVEEKGGIKRDLLFQMKNRAKLEVLETLENALNISTVLEQTEKELIAKARIGQSIFKKALLRQSKKCSLCGVEDERFLIASHIKKWSEATNEERLDVNNGLLLCPNHDSLFDKGFITFKDNGKILISSEIHSDVKTFLNVHDNMSIKMNEKQQEYMKWHRENRYRY